MPKERWRGKEQIEKETQTQIKREKSKILLRMCSMCRKREREIK